MSVMYVFSSFREGWMVTFTVRAIYANDELKI